MHAEGVLRSAESRLAGVSLSQTEDFNTVLLHEVYGSLLKTVADREREGEQYLAKAQELRDKLPVWAERALHLHIPSWHLE